MRPFRKAKLRATALRTRQNSGGHCRFQARKDLLDTEHSEHTMPRRPQSGQRAVSLPDRWNDSQPQHQVRGSSGTPVVHRSDTRSRNDGLGPGSGDRMKPAGAQGIGECNTGKSRSRLDEVSMRSQRAGARQERIQQPRAPGRPATASVPAPPHPSIRRSCSTCDDTRSARSPQLVFGRWPSSHIGEDDEVSYMTAGCSPSSARSRYELDQHRLRARRS